MVGYNLVEDSILPNPRKTFISPIWATIEYAPLTVSENDVKPKIRQSSHLFYTIHHHGGAPIVSDQSTRHPYRPCRASINADTRPINSPFVVSVIQHFPIRKIAYVARVRLPTPHMLHSASPEAQEPRPAYLPDRYVKDRSSPARYSRRHLRAARHCEL